MFAWLKPKFVTLLCALLLTSTLSTSAFALAISENEINQLLARYNNYKNNYGIPALASVDYNLHDFSARIGQSAEKRLELSGVIDGLFKLPTDQFSAKLNLTFDTVPYYDAQKGAIYLKDIRVLRWSGSPEQYMGQIQSLVPLLTNNIATYLSNTPVYTLDEKNPRDMMIKQAAKGIRVEQGRLEVDTFDNLLKP
ncbi:DUF1439 domain-containing protein [Aggregatibacter actinomycetemcomitans]|uniref:DUF1439 domain-containing protein n=1 Tax=Aggregatibacter actinomycetemcomitans TaxID=714 RepID=UPI00022ADAD7|nr:DUF1439 domain-containing protein [Aggregatibacter actinomycetemcomitans]KOE69942.1 membrane protein [Aggregatibacter actinomycetemcomitans serotype f str. D18P1]KYK88121.1 outer-membrane lipoprotein carrier protein [Aggregatibacter actinomycetemcomitans serotype f str. SC29R]MBN6061169.1 DUF1439 domain-containing protein [Aggregatibacter actinomycetemcomitans]OZV18512.1 DUF1439 domain-containing protein [Aggregatibacter actinomycetemcomitans]UEL53239.1 DUF1439 domain-containing protein [Ag